MEIGTHTEAVRGETKLYKFLCIDTAQKHKRSDGTSTVKS